MRRIIYIIRFAIGEFMFDMSHKIHPDWTYERVESGVIIGRK